MLKISRIFAQKRGHEGMFLIIVVYSCTCCCFFFSVYDVDFIAGLLQFAVHYYNKALEFPLHEASKSDGSNRGKVWLVNAKGCFQLPIFNFQLFNFLIFSFFTPHSFIQFSEKHDLHRETAFNLSLIYRASGNEIMARELLMTHCWV